MPLTKPRLVRYLYMILLLAYSLAGRTTITIAHRLSTIKDADCIYVMSDAGVLEKGKHDELLSNEDGPYAHLVAAQRLRESREDINIPDVVHVGQEPSEKAVESSADIEKVAMEEVALDRSNTLKSLASEIIERRKAQGLSKQEKEYSMFYLFKRMGKINKGEWKQYLFGSLFAMGNYPAFSDDLGFSQSVRSDWGCLPGFRYCLVCVKHGLCFPHGQGANYSVRQTALGVTGFSDPTAQGRRHAGDRNALW